MQTDRLRSSERWSWQVTGNPISWQGAVKLTYNAWTLSEVPGVKRQGGAPQRSAGPLSIRSQRFSSNDTGLLNFRFERVAANSSSKRLKCIGAVISSSARDNGHREGFSHAVCGYE